MRVAVTGGSGFIGSHVVDALLEAGHEAVIFDILPPRWHEGVPFFHCDISNREEVATKINGKRFDVLIHLAGFSNAYAAEIHPAETCRLNIEGTVNVLDTIRSSNCAFYLASTYYLSMGLSNFYSLSKVAAELFTKAYREKYGLPVTIFRLGTAYGPRSRGTDVISLFVEQALSGKPLVISNRDSSRKFIYVTDIAQAFLNALKANVDERTLVICADEPVSVEWLAKLVLKVTGSSSSLRYAQNSQLTLCYSPDNSEAQRILSWRPVVSLEEGIRLYVELIRDK